jgi:cytochrome c oxidase assembly protein subunit 11
MTPESKTRARATAFAVAAAAVAMLGLAFAAKPLYDTFCRITGFGGTTSVAERESGRVIDRPVRIRFDANVDPSVALTFKPETPFVDAKVGQNVLAFYVVENQTGHPIRAVAGYNVAPHKAGKHFMKVECFCFREKIFHPGHQERLPVMFYVSPDIENDRQAKDVRTITLSYTYYPVGEVPQMARLEAASAVN